MANMQQYEKIATMLLMGVPNSEIAAACSLSEGRISQILDDEDFKKIYSQKASERYEEDQELNEGWTLVEKLALTNVLQNLKYNKDPKYAIHAAMTANRAQKRGSAANKPLDLESLGARVVINLKPTFVNKLQVNPAPREIQNTNQFKSIDMLAPAQVERLLHEKVEDQFDEMFNDMPSLI